MSTAQSVTPESQSCQQPLESKMVATFDELICKLRGRFGFFQIYLCVFGCCIVMPIAMCLSFPIFMLSIPEHRCFLDGLNNDTYSVQSSHHSRLINASIPVDENGKLSSCEMFIHDGVTGNYNDSRQVVPCQKWVYDKTLFDRTLVEELDLVCDRKHVRTIGNVLLMVGRLVATPLPGLISDHFGRKMSVTFCVIGLVVATWSPAFIYNIPSLYILRFVAGFGISQADLAVMVLVVELLEPTHRRKYNCCVYLVWNSGSFIFLGMSSFMTDFQHLSFATAAPTSLLLIALWFIPESPRWLMSMGRESRAREVFRRMARVNGVPFAEEDFANVAATFKRKDHALLKKTADDEVETEHYKHSNNARESRKRTENTTMADTERISFFQLVKEKSLCLRCFVLSINWIAYRVFAMAILFNVSNAGHSLYLNFGLVLSAQFVGIVMSYLTMDRLGRSTSYLSLMFLSAVASLSSLLPVLVATSATAKIAVNILSLFGVIGITGAYVILTLYSAELVPTHHRNVAISLFDTSGRVGAVLGSFVADLGLLVGGQFQFALPLLVSGFVVFVSFLLAWLLPETRGTPLPNTIYEAKMIKRNNSWSLLTTRLNRRNSRPDNSNT